MIILNVFFDVQQQHEGEFVKLLHHMVVESNKEKGCEFYQLHRNVAEPLSYHLIEHWTTQDDLDAHAQSKHWKHFDKTVNDYLNSTYDEHHYREIDF
ncbi:quinol monooxygenase YgiN [Branchiibius hedensis]|uniref:Quinol monooxygenase YgiN n=1 Tax=Branchiibius hedensis TaxID=672460 RepID=A0A2Y8ZT41_9MICO|nr:putative quinol monooxygenase [Branchiibius hedensis]PWJ26342.1 quinol monooxygenase YgiN [Branchiibius hedensis]SSA35154.1 Quinol monooxygenase YgiN [Branchiibius hedensis]